MRKAAGSDSHLVDIYLIHPDGSGLKRISQHGDFCGSPKWTSDSKSVVAYCMSAQETWDFRFGASNGDDKLMKIDIATGQHNALCRPDPESSCMPSVLSSGEIAYLRHDKTAIGSLLCAAVSRGPPENDLHSPSWSPDGAQVVFSRYIVKRPTEPVKQFSKNPKFDLYSTAWLPAYDPTGEHLAVTKMSPTGETTRACSLWMRANRRTRSWSRRA